MKKLYKALRHFWLGLSKVMRTVLLAGIGVVLLSGALIVVLVQPEEPTTYQSLDLLFEAHERGQITSILLAPAGQDPYEIRRVTDETTGTSTFRLVIDGEVKALTVAATPLSNLIVGAGKNYVYSEVIAKPNEDDPDHADKLDRYEKRLESYRLTEDKASYYILTDLQGNQYKVYYGKQNNTKNGYFLRLEGKDVIYSSNTAVMGDILTKGPEQFAQSELLIPSGYQYSYAWPKSFYLTDHTRTEDGVVGASDRVGVICLTDGKEVAHWFDLWDEQLPDAIRTALVGQPFGDCDLTVTATFAEDHPQETVAGKTVTYHITSIECRETSELRFDLTYVQQSDRDLAHLYSIYEFTRPESMKVYLPDTSLFQTYLEKLLNLDGEVVKIGIDDAALKKYGIYKHELYIEYPYFTGAGDVFVKDENGNATDDINPAGYLPGSLWISDLNENGKYYVGSPLYDIIVEVDADQVAFVDATQVELVERFMVGASLVDISKLEFTWNYGANTPALDGVRYDMDITVGVPDGKTKEEVLGVQCTPKGETPFAIDPQAYIQFFYRFYYIQYNGMTELTDEEKKALIQDPDKTVLSVNVILDDGTVNLYRFIPVSAGRCMVVRSSGAVTEVGFLVNASAVKMTAMDFLTMISGEIPDSETRW